VNKKFLGRIFLSLAITYLSTSQAQWVQTNGPYGGNVSSITSIADTVFAATWGAYVISGSESYGAGVFRSTNSGGDWVQCSSGLTEKTVHALLAHASASNTMSLFAGTAAGVFLSNDYGASWIPFRSGLPSDHVWSLAVKDSSLYSLTTSGVYRTMLSKDEWISVSNGLPSTLTYKMVVSDSSLFVTTPWGIFRSKDDGRNWSSVNTGLPALNVYRIAQCNGILFANTYPGQVLRSSDKGENWIALSDQLPTGYISVAGDSTTIYITCDTRLFLSTDNGVHWTPRYGLGVALDCLTLTNGVLLGGHYGSGVYRSTDLGYNWYLSNIGINNTNISALGSDEKTVLAARLWGGLSYSTDSGESWQKADSGLGSETFSYLAVDGATFLGSTGTIQYLSKNEGVQWVQLQGLTNPGPGAVSGSKLFVATRDGFFFSSDFGSSWKKTSESFAVYDTRYPINAHYVYSLAANNVSIFAATMDGLFASSNNGISWALLTNKVLVRLVASGSELFAINTDAQIVHSTDKGASWSFITSVRTGEAGLDYRIGTYSLAVDSNWIYVGTTGGGVCRTPRPRLSITDAPASPIVVNRFSLYPNYPNPFNPSTTISYSLPKTAIVSLCLFNTLGQVIATLVNERKDAGFYQITWNANVPSGIYFYRLQAAEFVETKKVVLLK
jgi:photosystem II stability/assembly factor-like uncharacterized protein